MSFETLYLGYEMTFEKIWKVSKTMDFGILISWEAARS